MSKKKKSHTYEVAFPLLSKVAYETWPKEHFNTIHELPQCKQFLNFSYNKIAEELNNVLSKFHPAAWVREAYIQLEYWSVVLFNSEHKTKIGRIKGPTIFAPIGRYGWRYILEISLERIDKSNISYANRPQKNDIVKVFTLLLGLSHCSEISNYLHYFKDNLSSVKIKLSPFAYTTHPTLNDKDRIFFENLINYLNQKPDWAKYKQFSATEDYKMIAMINELLSGNFGFILDDIQKLIEIFFRVISPGMGASILVTSFEEAVYIFSKASGMSLDKIRSILDFILLDVHLPRYVNRDFLSRSQHDRMLNYAGAIIHLGKNLETIYDSKAANFDFVVSSSKHIILTGFLLGEWVDIFISRLAYGQRQDIKNINRKINLSVSAIEKYFHRDIFEFRLKELIDKKGFTSFSLEKIDGVPIACGEIDILAYHHKKNILFIVEAKYHAPAKDARSMGKVISDHFNQKRYHEKFMSKINWVEENMSTLKEIFIKTHNVDIDINCKRVNYFITGSPSPLKYIIKDYSVLTFYEFDKIITNEYKA